MNWRWFFSKTIRDVTAAHRHYRRLLSAQRDILPQSAIDAVSAALQGLQTSLKNNENIGALRLKAEELQFAGEKWLKPYPNATWRENVEVLLVALAVAMAIRTFFLQPFKRLPPGLIPSVPASPTVYRWLSWSLRQTQS